MIPINTKVKIKSIEWYRRKCKEVGNINFRIPTDTTNENPPFISYMSEFCGKTAIIRNITPMGSYELTIDGKPNRFYWAEEFFEIEGRDVDFNVTRKGDTMFLQYDDRYIEFRADKIMSLIEKLADTLE